MATATSGVGAADVGALARVARTSARRDWRNDHRHQCCPEHRPASGPAAQLCPPGPAADHSDESRNECVQPEHDCGTNEAAAQGGDENDDGQATPPDGFCRRGVSGRCGAAHPRRSAGGRFWPTVRGIETSAHKTSRVIRRDAPGAFRAW